MRRFKTSVLGVWFSLGLGVTGALAAPELVQDPSFEANLLPNWTIVGTAGVTTAPANVHSGAQALAIQPTNGDVSQTLTTSTGSVYTVSVWLKATSALNTGAIQLGANTPFSCSALSTTYQQCSTTFTALSNADAVHVLTSASTGGVYVDDVSVQFLSAPAAAVPTLQQWALIVMAGLFVVSGLWWMRRRPSFSKVA